MNESEQRQRINTAITRGSQVYIDQCRARIPGFIEKHYSLRGSWRLHKQCLGWDLLRTPINIAWSSVCLIAGLVSWLFGILGFTALREKVQRLPKGLTTTVDRQLNALIYAELLQLPSTAAPNTDALLQQILRDEALAPLLSPRSGDNRDAFFTALQTKLEEYAATRSGTADFANNLLMAVGSKLALGKAFFGGLTAGTTLASLLASYWAVKHFWLGETLGRWFYAVVPVSTPLALTLGTTAAFVMLLAISATFIGVISDPLQARLSIHTRRLNALLDAIEADLCDPNTNTLRLHEKYAGRVFDVLDMASTLRIGL